jgi:uncharacterized protein YjiS (DUF1127 family)
VQCSKYTWIFAIAKHILSSMVSEADVFGLNEDPMSNRLAVAPEVRVPTVANTIWGIDEQKLIAEAQRLRSEYIGALLRRARRRVAARLAEIGHAFANARAARVLGEMSDRELADIGLTRADIAAIAAGRAQDIAEGRKLHVETAVRERVVA